MTATPHLTHRVRDVQGCATLELCGDLDQTTAPAVRAALEKVLMDRGRVVAELPGLTVSWQPALTVFPSVLARAGGWPLARLVLLGADAALANSIRAARIDTAVPLADNWAAARTLLSRRPERICREVTLPATVEASRLARLAAAGTCQEWDAEGLSLEAQMVATELVVNAVEHAGTESTLVFTLTASELRIAVRDWAPIGEPECRRFGDPGHPGRGLVLVNGLVRHWGVTPHPDGKTVWAMLNFTG
jgi:anti-sigma regulatory factor (Ser/Thr protein kinase)